MSKRLPMLPTRPTLGTLVWEVSTVEGHETPDWWEPYAGQFPRWHAWKGVSGLAYARMPGSSPPLVARGEDAQDLADEIRRQESQLEDRLVVRPSCPQSSSAPCPPAPAGLALRPPASTPPPRP